jgi:ribonuclease R
MAKKKKNKRFKPKSLSVPALERRIIDVCSKQVSTRFDAKTLIRKLRLSNSKDSVQYCLDQLAQKGTLIATGNAKYQWNKNANRTPKNHKEAQSARGTVDITRRGAAFIVCEDKTISEKDIFVPPHKLKGALHGDQVEVSWYLSRKGKPEGRILAVLQRKTDQYIGTLVLSRKFAFVVPDNPNMQSDIVVDPKSLTEEAEEGSKVVVRIVKWPNDHGSNPEGEISTYLGTEDSNDIAMKSILINKGFNLSFPPEVLAENALIDTQITVDEIAKRRDMRAITTFTIDPLTAKDFDDALSIQLLDNGHYEIGIHIADVTHYIQPGSALDKEAAKRTTSVYLVDRVLPMLPENLSNGVCSLRPEEEKLTFSAIFELDKTGAIVSEWFGKTVIYSDRRFTYEEAQERIESKEGDFAEELNLLNFYAHQLRKSRFQKGAINFESPEVRFKLDDEGIPLEVYLKSRQDAHMLVEDFMLLANKRVGAVMHGLHASTGTNWPMVYRIHDEPNMEKVEQFATFTALMGYPLEVNSPEEVRLAYGTLLKQAEGQPEYDILQQLAIRTMAKAVYSTDNIGHYGLGFLTYSHFTSPIRRYADVLAHRILFDHLCKNNKRMNADKLASLCKHISKKERDAMEAERESTKFKQAEFLESKIGELFEGAISGVTDHGIYVTLSANFCEGMVRYNKMYDTFVVEEAHFQIKSPDRTYRMGDDVWVRILGADKHKKQIDLELLDPEDPDNQPPASNAQTLMPPVVKAHTGPILKVFNKVKVVPEPKHVSPYRNKIKKETKGVHQLYEEVLPLVEEAFKLSDIRTVANKKRVKWKYEWCPYAPQPKANLLLEFNPVAEKRKGYRQQKVVSQHRYSPKGILQQFLNQFLDDRACNLGYFSPFRSIDEKQLSSQDIDLSLPLFESYIRRILPHQIIVFSSYLVFILQEKQLLQDYQQEEISLDGRTILVAKGQFKFNEFCCPIYFLPKPSSRLPRPLKEQGWIWAFSPSDEHK